MAAESFMNLSPWDYYLQVLLSSLPFLCLAVTPRPWTVVRML
jgi:hypothetical protein